jgi:tRNA pseudouridine38-40 synthase
MRRWVAGVAYAGTAYSGWQRLPHIESVQARVEAALSGVANHEVKVAASGRTDAGVHAAMQVIHFDSDAPRDREAWLRGGNSRLPADIALQWVMPAPEDFHARHAAAGRRYRYVIANTPAPPALWRTRSAWLRHPLDAGRMHEAAQPLVGEHDFSAFRAAECQSRTPMRRITDIAVWRKGEFVALDVRGNAFLHHMVRNIAGSLMLVGRGLQPPAWMGDLLAGRDRRLAAATAPAEGLYLLGAEYPEHPDIASPADPVFP